MLFDNKENEKRKLEIIYQWEFYKENSKTLTQKELKILKSEAKRLGVKLN